MTEKTKGASPLGVGVITIFMVLIVLVLSLLSTLALSTARSDLYLSQVNADTVTAYYEADALAAELYAQFAAGDEAYFDETIIVSENQSLYVSFGRDAAGEPLIYEWRTISEQGEELDDFNLPVWLG